MIGDHYKDYLPKKHNNIDPSFWEYVTVTPRPTAIVPPAVSKEEFDALKKDVEEMKELLKRAIKYDEENNEPHCEVDEKVEFIKKLAEYIGVDLTDVLPK